MAELLLELFSEEIPARLQARAADDLKRLVGEALKAEGVEATSAAAYATPRRLTLVLDGLPAASPDVAEERKGPKVGAAEKAIEGFMRAAGLASIDEADVQEDKKGAFYVARIERKGRPVAEIVAEKMPEIVRAFPWPKSMRWGAGQLRWVRPLQRILCLIDGVVVPFDVDGIASGAVTEGHRFMAPDAFDVVSFADYRATLEKAYVLLDGGARAARILDGAKKLAASEGLALVEDAGLLAEVAGLVEWPVVLMGAIDADFMSLPEEVLTSTMRAHQKYLALTDAKAGALAPRFIVVSNIVAKDGGKAVVAGNERVLRARFGDARFLWDQDRQTSLEDRLEKLEAVTFYDRLGTMAEKARHLGVLTRALAQQLKRGDEDQALMAGRLAKADLVTGMVYEFPDLQGLMGGYYARAEGLPDEVAQAISEHYRPAGPSDDIPETDLGRFVAIADKALTLMGFFGIDEKPTGSKDPYALRRAALGMIRIVLESGYRLPLTKLCEDAFNEYLVTRPGELSRAEIPALVGFFIDRLKVHLREQGVRHDLVDAVFALPKQDDLVAIVERVRALEGFLATDDGANLLAGYKRAANILRIEEKKDGKAYDGAVAQDLLADAAERDLAGKLDEVAASARAALKSEDYVAAMTAMAALRGPVDRFFDEVTVNSDEPSLRANRLKLLSRIRGTLDEVADFSRVEG